EVVGEAANAEQAHGMIEDLRPDLLLLDIQMPGGSGFDLLGALNHAPKTIFTTAFDQYALRAFEVSALDYLLKPIEPKRLTAALARVDAAHQVKNSSDTGTIFIKDGSRCWFVELRKIILFESEGNYTRVFFDAEQPLMLRSLLQLEQSLDPAKYRRANRKHIVNITHIVRIDSLESGGLMLAMSNGAEVTVSRRRAAEFKTGIEL
ncbi:MAG TPA: LytTR family DNA-binding domain-containing protein, partial [Burkholderiaceae bacterium]|nr:LytTR family DNA-binding domain-containing protein [Burkholderiaceae bacterium]